LTGQEFKDHLAMRMKKTSELGKPEAPDIPNIPLVIGIGLGCCLIFIVIDSVRARRISKPEIDAKPESRSMAPVQKTIALIIVVIGYVAAMQQWVPFVWATTAFILCIGALLSDQRKRIAIPLLETALVVSFGVNFLLTEVVVTDLP
jgi:hypothetical protein